MASIQKVRERVHKSHSLTGTPDTCAYALCKDVRALFAEVHIIDPSALLSEEVQKDMATIGKQVLDSYTENETSRPLKKE